MTDRRAGRVSLSIVVPSWRDADNLAVLLPQLARLEPPPHEIFVVDASDDNRAKAIVADSGATYLLASAPNRGAQMNLGGRAAEGDVLLFQHADTEFTSDHAAAIVNALCDPKIIGGAFYRKFDSRHPRLMWLEQVARFLTRRGGTLYGDQSVFVRRKIFLQLDGFAQIPLMEDMEFSRRLRAAGPVVILDPPVKTSPRRHARAGSWRTSIQNGIFIVLFKLGVSPHTLHRWYYRQASA